MKRRVLNSPRLKKLRKKRRENLKKRALITLIIFFFVLLALVFLASWEKVKITYIEINGNKVIETQEVEDIVEEEISGNYLWVFPKSNFLFLPKEEITERILKDFSRIKSVKVESQGISKLKLIVEEYEGKYLWCGQEPVSDTENRGCYYLDEEGYIFDSAPYFSGEVYLKFFGKLDGTKDTIGQYFIEGNIEDLIEFKNLADLIGVDPVSFHVDELGDINMYLTSKTTELGPRVIFKKEASYRDLAENLDTILSTESFRTLFREQYSSLEYIDLRFGNKVYYKFEEE